MKPNMLHTACLLVQPAVSNVKRLKIAFLDAGDRLC